MALTSLLNLVAPIAEPAIRPSQDLQAQAPVQSQTPLAQPVGNTTNTGGRQDEFVFSNPDSQAQAFEQAAGLFTVKQPAVFAPAADLLLTPATPPPAGANAVAATATTPPTTPGGTAGAAVGSPSVEDQLQALNIALVALGLNPADISKVDQIASLINDFSPTAYNSLVYQLVAQAANTVPPAP